MQTKEQNAKARARKTPRAVQLIRAGNVRIRDLQVELVPIGQLQPGNSSPRTHTEKKIGKLTKAMTDYGWTSPLLVDENLQILAGVARFHAAKILGMAMVPVIRITGLSAAQKRAYVLADNRLAEEAGWDRELLGLELKSLIEIDEDFDLTLTGFDMVEIDVALTDLTKLDHADDAADVQPVIDPARPLITRPGDMWIVGRHKLLCGDARNLDDYRTLLDDVGASMVFTDPPYNVAVRKIVGLGAVKHDEFAMASGEMTQEEYSAFLHAVARNLVQATPCGSIHYICIDWKQLRTLLNVGHATYSELKNICVWTKTNGGMGSLYRSQHEIVCVYKNGTSPHINNIELGKHGRNRTNVWPYAGVNAFGEERRNLALHPTVKPVKLIEDAILDCSDRDDGVLDPFCGSGSTLIAAERVGRRGCGIEIEPRFVDVALRRIRDLTGEEPVRHDGATLKSLE